MVKLKSFARNWLMAFISPRPLVGLFFLPRFFGHWARYAKSAGAQKIRVLDLQPCLGDWSTHTPFDAHYFYQGAWLARRVISSKVARHVDIGSSVLTMSVLSALDAPDRGQLAHSFANEKARRRAGATRARHQGLSRPRRFIAGNRPDKQQIHAGRGRRLAR